MVTDHLIGFLDLDWRLHFFELDDRRRSEEAHERVPVFWRELKFDEDLERRDVAVGIFHEEVTKAVKDFWNTYLCKR